MTNPTVSVIIPCYNNEVSVGATLRSLQKQTFRDWEAIVVNDGSTDDSARIIRQFGTHDARVMQIDQKNKGLADARNTGLTMAKGEFVIFLDADDLLLSNMLNRMVQNLKEDTSLGAISCGWIFSDPVVEDLSWVNFPPHEGQLFEKLAHGNLFPCHSVLMRSEILKNVGEFDCSLKHCHDWDLWLRVARTGSRFGCVREPLVVYRMVPVSLSRNPLTFFESEKEVIRRGHCVDQRVKKPAKEFAQGCKCSMKEAIIKRLFHNVGVCIAQGDAVLASRLLEETFEKEDLKLTPKDMRFMNNALWFGTAIPEGNWHSLWKVISRPLLEFLIRQEERLGIPGFAMDSVLEIIGWHELQQKSNAEAMYGRDLLRALKKKIISRLVRSFKLCST